MYAVVFLICNLLPLPASGPILEARVLEPALADGRVIIAVEADGLAAGSRLVLAAGTEPIGSFTLAGREAGRATFAGERLEDTGFPEPLRAWLMAPDTVRQLLSLWPTYAPLVARIDRIGPGGRSVWLRAGSNHGVQTGDQWWVRIAGQPVARFDVRSVEPEACCCAVVPLAAGLVLHEEEPAELWPGPGQRRRGLARTAVTFVDRSGEGAIVWVAAPRNVACPSEPHLDFYRGQRYIGHGVVEARDELFWYTRFVPISGGPRRAVLPRALDDQVGEAAPAADSQPTADGESTPVRVGDTALIRTQVDIEQGRFTARVFETSADGALINAGEGDGLTVGQRATLLRDGETVSEVEIQRVQRGYSVIRPAAGESGEPVPGDEVRFHPPRPRPKLLARVEMVRGGTLFSARLVSDDSPPLLVPLAIRSAGRTIGAAVLLAAEGRVACGEALGASLSARLEVGSELSLEEEPPDEPGAR